MGPAGARQKTRERKEGLVDTILLVLALICFVLAAFGWNAPRGIGLMPLGLAFWVLTALI
jgi:hypothetical protein